jgi:hypothetical protein
MNLDIGAKKPIDGNQVFLVGRCFSSADSPFVLLYDADKRRRTKRNIQKMDPLKVVTALGAATFIEVEYPQWGRVWFRASKIRAIRELTRDELVTSPAQFGSLVLFEHDPDPEDEHAGFLLFGMEAKQTSRLLSRAAEE